MTALAKMKRLTQHPSLQPLRRSIKNAIPQISEHILAHPWVESQVLCPRYEAYMRRHQPYRRALIPSDQAVVTQLNKTGQHVTSLDELLIPGNGEFFEAGEQLFHALAQRAENCRVKFQITPDFALLKAHLQIFQWGLSERLLAIAENYIGLPIAYDTCLCNISVNNGVEAATRRWHLDNEDRRVLKVIIYFNDVEAGGGPFQCFDPEVSQHILKLVGDRCAFFPDATFTALAQSEGTIAVPQTYFGAKGTVTFVDTARVYHRGQPPTARSRRAVTFGYCSRKPLRPFRCNRNQLSRSQLNQLAIGLDESQKSCIYWQDELPQWIRRIPTYSYG